MKYFTLNSDGEVQAALGPQEWASFMEKAEREKNHQVFHKSTLREPVVVSTSFLGIGLQEGTPLWETRVDGGSRDGLSERSKTHFEAELTHERMVKLVRRRK